MNPCIDVLIPEKLNLETHEFGFMTISSFSQRESWIKKGMYAFVCWQWVDPLAVWLKDKNVLEVMAGAGWLAKALRQKGVEVIATDDYSWYKLKQWEIVSTVEELGAIESVTKYGGACDVLIISWPYMDETAFYVIKELYRVNRDCFIIYIGEDQSGCTASDNFFEHFEEVNDTGFNRIANFYKAWPGMHDRLQLGKYNSAK